MVLIMPTYDIQNKKTGEVKEIFCSYKDKEKELKKQGKDWEYLVGAPGISYEGSINTIRRGGDGWNDVLKQLKKTNPGSNIETN